MTTHRARKVLLCVCGGYQAYTVPGFVVALLRHFADDVQVVLSRAAARLVSPDAVEIASRNRVFVDMFDRTDDIFVPHIELSRDTDLTLVYPATVNLIGKLAHGIADELIPALLLASETPTVIVPVANESMIAHPSTVRNLETLRRDGYLVVDPPSSVEIASRKDIDERVGPFPYPALLMCLSAVASGSLSATPVRPKS
jgi:phosphopantothenoylcysteine decarboxylase/phosphopantothenate--cysteine ligase